MGCFHLLAYVFVCEVGPMVPRQGCCDEGMQCPMSARYTAALLDQLGPYQGLGSVVILSLSTTLWVEDAGVARGRALFFNPSPSPFPTPWAETKKKIPPLPWLNHIFLGVGSFFGLVLLVYFLGSFRCIRLW